MMFIIFCYVASLSCITHHFEFTFTLSELNGIVVTLWAKVRVCSSLCLCENILISPSLDWWFNWTFQADNYFSWIKRERILFTRLLHCCWGLSIIYIPLKIIFLFSLYLQLSLSLMFRNFGKTDADLFSLIPCNLLYFSFLTVLLAQILFVNFWKFCHYHYCFIYGLCFPQSHFLPLLILFWSLEWLISATWLSWFLNLCL